MIRSLLTALLAVVLVTLGFAQTQSPPTNINTLVSFRGGSVSQVISHRIGIAHNAFAMRGFDVDIRGFGGVNFTAGNAVTSGIILAPVAGWAIAREVSFKPLLFGAATSGRRFDYGIGLELTFNFNS